MIGRKSILSAEARASLEPLPQQETSPESDKTGILLDQRDATPGI